MSNNGHVCMINMNGELYGWGWNYYNQVLSGSTSNIASPTKISHPSGLAWKQVSCGYFCSYAIDINNNLYCWGYNYGQISGNVGNRFNITKVTNPSTTWKQVSCGQYATMALDTNGNIYVCSSNSGVGVFTKVNHPSGLAWKYINCNYSYQLNETFFAIDINGNLYGWGNNTYKQITNSTTTSITTPTIISHPLGLKWKQVSCLYGYFGTTVFALDLAGDIYGWGNNRSKEVTFSLTDSAIATPLKINHPNNLPWKQIAGGENSNKYFIDINGKLYGWGQNGDNLITSTTGTVTTPLLINHPLGLAWKQVSYGGNFVIVIDINNNLYGWGYNNYYQINNTTNTVIKTPYQISGTYNYSFDIPIKNVYSKKIYYRRNGSTFNVNLWDYSFSSNCMIFKDGSNLAFVDLGSTADLKASNLRVRKNGIIYAVLSE